MTRIMDEVQKLLTCDHTFDLFHFRRSFKHKGCQKVALRNINVSVDPKKCENVLLFLLINIGNFHKQ